MSDDKVVHVQIVHSQRTRHYYVIMKNKAEEIVTALDIGEDEENVKKVVKVLTEEYGGIALPPGWRN